MRLERFFSTEGFLTDLDGDGVPDGLRGRIALSPGCSPDEALTALNLLARLAYECAAMPLDAITFDPPAKGDLAVASARDLPAGLARLCARDGVYWLEASAGDCSGADYFIGRMPYTGAVGEGQPTLDDFCSELLGDGAGVTEITARRESVIKINGHAISPEPLSPGGAVVEKIEAEAPSRPDLADLFSVRGLFADPENGILNDRTPYRVEIDERLSMQGIVAAGNLVSRLCVESLSFRPGLVRHPQADGCGPALRIVENDDVCACLRCAEGGLELAGEPQALLAFSRLLAGEYPYVDENRFTSLRDIIAQLEGAASGNSAAGQLSALLDVSTQTVPDIYLSDTSIVDAGALSGRANIKGARDGRMIWEDSAQLPCELEAFRAKVTALCDELCPGDQVEIFGLLDRDRATRDALACELGDAVRARGALLRRCTLLCAYKQGLSWLTEDVAPRLRGLDAARIIIRYRPFAYRGIPDWSAHEGDIPPFDIKDKNWLDLPIRFFNELYPADDLLAQALGIHRDQITFEAAKLSSTYQIECINSAGARVFAEDFEVTLRERPYLEDFPELGPVWVNTGRLRASVNGSERINETMLTDLERVWEFGQRSLFRKAGALLARVGEGETPPAPAFREVVLECALCAVDEPLPTRTDTLSSLETLHEDIHFVGLEYFKHLGRKLFGREINEPGLILPIVRKQASGPPQVRARIVVEAAPQPCLQDGQQTHTVEIIPCALRVCALSWSPEGPLLQLETDDARAMQRLARYAGLLSSGVIQDDVSRSGWNFVVSAPGADSVVIHTQKPAPAPARKLDPARLPTDQPIGYSGYIDAMHSLRGVKGLSVSVAAKSYQGRDIYAVELLDTGLNDIVSRGKLIGAKPSYLLNNRHHANEVSSTGMSFELIQKLLHDPEWQVYRRGIHIAMIPFANVDGGAIHELLCRDNPTWMLHAARFNAVGMETRPLYFDDCTKFTEATALPRVWRLCLPDIVADNHGIPNHECNFPAFGGNRMELRANWLPCAQFFGYMVYITEDARYRANHAINDRVRERVAEAIGADPQISALNSEWRDRYEKYAHSAMPSLFAANYHKGVIFHQRRQSPGSDFRFICLKYPDITIMDWVTEVADETATGKDLEACVKTHLIACRATMDSILSFGARPENRDREDASGIFLHRRRSRPIKL